MEANIQHFPIAANWIKEQLADTSAHRSLFQSAAEVYTELLLAIDTEGPRGSLSVKSAGVFGGYVKTWKAGLIAVITQDIINKLNIDVSRERVRSLQFDIFGRAQASKDLKNYAIKVRTGGGRPAPMPDVPEWLKARALDYFKSHEDDLKTAVQSSPQLRPGGHSSS